MSDLKKELDLRRKPSLDKEKVFRQYPAQIENVTYLFPHHV